MSRIPPPQSGLPRTIKRVHDENTATQFKIPVAGSDIKIRPGCKRPGEPRIALAEKKQRLNIDSTTTKNVFSAAPSTAPRSNGFSGKTRRVVFPPIPDTGVRGSLPPMSLSAKPKSSGKQKRPAWDLKGRIQDMEDIFHQEKQRNTDLTEQFNVMNEAYNQRIAALESANSMLNKDVEIKSTLSEEATATVARLEKELREKNEEISMLNDKNNNLSTELSNVKDDYCNLKKTYTEETTVLKSTVTSLTCSKSGLQAQVDASEILVQNLRSEIQLLSKQKSEKEHECENLKRIVSDLESKLLFEETTRRKLHNTIQELKGNIRVYCRMRPALPDEIKNGLKLAEISCSDKKIIEVHQSVDNSLCENGKNQKKFEFTFDSVFTPSTCQQEVFEEISQLVQSAIDGYNVCIFAYGQTGSGKTYTMEGPENVIDFLSSDHESNLGMIPRSVRQIFECIQGLEPRGWVYKLEAYFLQIYNERIHDLLNPDSLNGNTKCEIIKSAAKGNDVLLSNVTASPVTCAEEVFQLLKKARINRTVAATKCNEHSSRSHYVFQLKINGNNTMTGEQCEGILNLVDLAGSERVKESGSAGERLTEAKAINKSLSTLGKVIMSLSKRENHVPYRDSKLTHLLANSLGGNSKTLMFVNVSPDNESISETINSLRFATQVNQCNIGTAQKRVK